jgi:hypothetical protein
LKWAFVGILIICIIRGLSRYFIWKGSFCEGFLYPFILFAIGNVILLPLFLLNKHYPKLASVLCGILLIVAVTFLAGVFILLLTLLLNAWLHFWF